MGAGGQGCRGPGGARFSGRVWDLAVYGKGGSAPALPGQWTRCFWKVPAFRFLSRPVRGFGGQLGDSVGRVRRAQRPGASGRGPFGARSARRRGRFGGAARVAGASLPARPPPLPGAQARPPPPPARVSRRSRRRSRHGRFHGSGAWADHSRSGLRASGARPAKKIKTRNIKLRGLFRSPLLSRPPGLYF